MACVQIWRRFGEHRGAQTPAPPKASHLSLSRPARPVEEQMERTQPLGPEVHTLDNRGWFRALQSQVRGGT